MHWDTSKQTPQIESQCCASTGGLGKGAARRSFLRERPPQRPAPPRGPLTAGIRSAAPARSFETAPRCVGSLIGPELLPIDVKLSKVPMRRGEREIEEST
eukprot:Polyplicarium_translucidae@DN3340_c0_g1_i4.p2